MVLLRRANDVPFGLPASGWMLGIGAAFLRTETELILKGRRVVPGRLLEQGFKFNHPHWSSAARDLCDQWRTGRRSRQSYWLPSRLGTSPRSTFLQKRCHAWRKSSPDSSRCVS
jgi:hypothetical protein